MVLQDTDVISHLLRRTAPQGMRAAVLAYPPEQRFLSAITVGEIVYGFEKAGPGSAPMRAAMERDFLSAHDILPFDDAAARVYGVIKADLRRRNLMLDEPDLRIAAIALSRDLILATGNRRHYERVPGLRLLEW